MFLLVIAGSGVKQDPFPKVFPNSGKRALVSPGNEFPIFVNEALDCGGTANTTRTASNFSVPFACEVTRIDGRVSTLFAADTTDCQIGIALAADNILTAGNAIAVHTLGTEGDADNDMIFGTYDASNTDSNVLSPDTNYEIVLHTVVADSGTEDGGIDEFVIWCRPIANTEN